MAGSPGTPITPAPMTMAAGGAGAANPYSATRIEQRYGNYGPVGGIAAGVAESMRGAATEMGYQPGQIGAPMTQATGYGASQVAGVGPITAQNVQAGQLAGTGLDPYMNPYTEQVIRASEQDILRGAQLGLNQLGAQAQAARAFGGSRQAVTEAELGRNVLQQLAQSSAGLRSQGFQQAQAAAQQDIAARMQAALANQQAGLQAGTTTAQLGLQGQLANQAALNQAAQFGAGAYNQAAMQNAANMLAAQQANQQAGLAGSAQRLQAAGQLGSLSNLGFGMVTNINQQLAQQGLMEQAMQQALIDAAKTQYAGYVGAPIQALNTQLGAYAGSQTGEQTQTASKQPGLFDYLSLGASFASDARLKENIKEVGRLENGLGIYTWDWNEAGRRVASPHQPTIGVMAQEVIEVMPKAVTLGEDGYYRVNYGKVLRNDSN